MRDTDVSRVRYIHYGSDIFDPTRLNGVIRNADCPRKPFGGVLWASPADTDDWRHWVIGNEYRTETLNESFTFHLKDPSKFIFIETEQDLLHVIERYLDSVWGGPRVCLDYVKMKEEGYSGIYIAAGSNEFLYCAFYGWDVDSIVIWDPDQIVLDK